MSLMSAKIVGLREDGGPLREAGFDGGLPIYEGERREEWEAFGSSESGANRAGAALNVPSVYSNPQISSSRR